MNQMSGECRPSFTPKQGQYLAFIDAYTRVHRRPPAEREMQRHFGVTPPSGHQVVRTLERAGLIRRQPGVPRSIEVLVPPEDLPVLQHISSRSKPLCRGTSNSMILVPLLNPKFPIAFAARCARTSGSGH